MILSLTRGLVWGGVLALLMPGSASAIPVFARQYRTTCTTCHVIPPKLNSLGEAFRLNGYRFPRTNRLVRQEPTVPLGDEAWKDEWPRAIWPGEVSGTPGVSLRLQSDVEVRRAPTNAYAWSYRFPADVYLLGAATLGDGIGAFVESEWSPDVGFRVLQAKVTIQDPIPALPRHLLGVWFGLQGLYPMFFADRQLDRAARQVFSWQTFAVSDVRLDRGSGSASLRSGNDMRLINAVPSVEVEGVVGGRVGYGIGLAQGTSPLGTDRNNAKDPYLRVRVKLGGLRLDGEQPAASGRVHAVAGQLRDRTVSLEAFAYTGREPGAGGVTDSYRRGVASARLLAGPFDVGVGVAAGVHDDPWGVGSGARFTSVFAKGELMPLPWLLVSLKGERARFVQRGPLDQTSLGGDPGRLVAMPGLVLLGRPNARLAIEGELHLRRPGLVHAAAPRPHALWLRTDLSF